MADAAVEFLLENLKQLLLYHAQLIQDAQSQVEILEDDLGFLKAFLKEHNKKWGNEDETLKELVKQIRDVIYEAEDVIDSFITQAEKNKTRNYLARVLSGPPKLLSFAKEVEGISAKVKNMYEKMDRVHMEDYNFHLIKDPGLLGNDMIGYEDEIQALITCLSEEREELDVISIVGMPGVGKTALAHNIFCHSKIKDEFPTRIWVSVSSGYTKKDVLLAILSNFTEVDNMTQKTDNEIAEILHSYLERIKFLIVMDDVWSAEAWIDLQDAFPKLNRMGKILITSHNKEVARQANRSKRSHKMRLMTLEEGWQLLKLEVFRRPESQVPPEAEELGKLIVERCGRLPLAILAIGHIIVSQYSAGLRTNALRNTLRDMSERVNTYLDVHARIWGSISRIYNNLPYYLRPCFLYLGMFPEEFEIPVWKLIRIWIAEGFIPHKTGISQEKTAQDYLDALINRNLVMVGKVRPDGKIKTCHIHEILRQFCKNEAECERENFFQEMRKWEGGFQPSVKKIREFRRICIHSDVVSFISSKPYGPRVRSFLCLSKEKISLQHKNNSFIPAAFKLLRVLEVESFNFTRFPSCLSKLVHLRHIALSSNFEVLPEAISKLWNLQTLIVYTTSHILEIKADIWNMIQLRHVKTNASAILPKPGKSSKECEQLQTLGMISHQSCTEDVFDRVRSLIKLGICGQLVTLLDTKVLEKLYNLQTLKLVNESKLPGLPQCKFPPKLRSLTLCHTFLDWNNMSVLAMVGTLEVLKLRGKAFVGSHWEATDGGLGNLQFLLIDDTDLVTWKASADYFPRLECLVLRNCRQLEEIPSGLGENLLTLDLEGVNLSAAVSARKIKQRKATSGSSGFNLSIGLVLP